VIKFDPTNNILGHVSDNGISLIPVTKSESITKSPNRVEDQFNKKQSNCVLPLVVGGPPEEDSGNRSAESSLG